MQSQGSTQSEFLHQLLESTLVSFAMLDRDMRYVKANRRYLTDYRLSAESIIGRSFYEVFPDLPQGWKEAYRRCLAGATERIGDYPFHFDGATVSARWELQPWHGSEGQIDGILLFSEVIPANHQPQSPPRMSEAQYFSIFQNNPQPMWIYDLETLRFLNVNNAAIHHYGYTYDEFLQMTIKDIRPKDDVVALLENIEKVTNGLDIAGCWRHLKKDGTLIFVEITSHTLTFDNRPAELVMAQDITERISTESGRQLLLKAIEQTAGIIMLTDPDGAIKYVNPAFEEVTGYSREEILGKSPDLLRSGEESDDYYREMWAEIGQGKTWRGRFVNKRKDGSLYTEDACISPVTDNQGRITNFVATKHDITHQLAIEQQFLQAQKMESVGQLAGGIAHDFNNMLSLIIGRAELGMRKLDTSDVSYQTLNEIQSVAHRSAKLTQQLLAFARKQTIAPRTLDLNNTVESMLQILKRLIGENIDLVWLPGTSLWPIKVDPAQFDQILTNLTVNARDAITNIGKVTIESSTVTFDQAYCDRHAGFKPGEFTKLAISDDGAGMDSEIRKRIFEPFYTTKALGVGTGLGLATVYGIVKQNNGFINVYSEPGQGTTFSIYFPRFHGEAEEFRIEKTSAVQGGRGQTILLVEDDKSLLKLSEDLLNELGYRVFATKSPAGAIQIATTGKNKIDLLITDVVMPAMNGKKLAETLLNHRPALKVLFTSGYTANVIAHQGILDEGVNFLQKPVSINELAKKLYEIFD